MKNRPQNRVTSRRAEPRPASSRALWWSLAALVLCLGGLWAVFFGIFRIHHVDVVGRGLPAATIQQVAGVTNQNVFTIQSDQVVSRLSSIPEIAVERVETSFPDRVTVYAQERRPMVVWQKGRARYELDPDGNVIRAVAKSTLPVIVGPASQRGRIQPGIIQAVRYAVQTLPTIPNGRVAVYRVSPAIGLTIVGRAGWTAVVGRGPAQSLANRIATLAATLAKLQQVHKRLVSVDLRFATPPMRAVAAP